MELQCSRCGRTFWSWKREEQLADYPICVKCEYLNDFMPTIEENLADVDPVLRQDYFQALADDLFDPANDADFGEGD